MTRPVRRRLVGTALLAALAAPAPAQEAAGQALRVIIPQPPGGATDVLARLLSEPLSRELSRPVVVENRPGANGIVSINALKQSRPDGGTLLLGGVSTSASTRTSTPACPTTLGGTSPGSRPWPTRPSWWWPGAAPASPAWRSSWSAPAPGLRA